MENVEKEIDELSEQEAKEMLKFILLTGYAYVEWDNIGEYIKQPWFAEEAILDLNGTSAHFVPLNRIL